ncbi:hypothetical protein FQZ97_979730 [compost metagenome]
MRLHETDQLDFLLLGLGAEDVQAVFDQRIQVELHVVQFDLPGLQFGDVEDLVDQGQQLVAGTVDGLHIIALLGRQRRAEQQLGHAQYAVHRRADFVADLGEEFGLGLQLGGAGGQGAAGAEFILDDASLAFAQRHAEDEATEHAHRQQAVGRPVGLHRPVAEKHRQRADEGQAKQQQRHAEQPRRQITVPPVVHGHQQNAQAGDRRQ